MNRISFNFRRLPASGVRLHVAEAGQGSPVLLLHGFPDHWRLWEPLMNSLACEHRLMAPDLRGINLSDKPSELASYDIDYLASDVLALIDHLGGRCALVGHDWGGLLAWTVASKHPERVSRLAVFNAPHPCRFAQLLHDSPEQRKASAYMLRLREPSAEQRLAARNFELLRAVRSPCRDDRGPADQLDHWVKAWSQSGALTAALNWYRALDVEAALSADGVASVPRLNGGSGMVSVPTLLVWGERDGSFVPACLDGLQAWVPDLRIHRVPHGGHWLLEEEPELVAALLGDFLGKKD